jgi:hypothetical protein
VIEIGALAQLLITQLENESGMLVGDGIAPVEGGWIEGQPNVKAFRPYAVLMQGPATPASPDRVVPHHSEWMVNYSLRTFAGSAEQLRFASQTFRNTLATYKPTFGTGDVFKTVFVHWDQLGSNVRNDQVDPPYWQTFDALRFEVSRSRNQP